MPIAINEKYAEKLEQRAQKEAAAEQDKLASAKFIDMIQSRDNEQEKAAESVGTDLIRERVREKSFAKTMFTWTTTHNTQLVPQLKTEENIRYFDYEVDSPASMAIGLYGNPGNYLYGGRRGAMKFYRMITPRMFKDVNEMRTYSYDIRRIIADNVVRDMAVQFDTYLIWGIYHAVGGAPDAIPKWSEAPQWKQYSGNFGRETVPRMKEQMIKVQGDRGFVIKHALVNTVTALQPAKLGRDEMGGDLAQDLMRDGVTYDNWGGLTWTTTIKRKLVKDGEIFTFCDEDYFIRCSMLQETTMYIDSKMDMIEFVAADNSGMLLANLRCVNKIDLLDLAA
ncbi:MAG: hypothetical protein LBL62_02295 [Planctomycetaceae bacterium]|jgi:hypothetical protein|nr:hypothetical protein [Planctomycetaceae bacterium]